MKRSFLALTIICCLASCASYDMKIAGHKSSWKTNHPTDSISEIYHSIYLIGDVGGAKQNQSTIPLIQLKDQLATDKRDDSSTDVVFLGDNIYPVGMPPLGHENRADAEHKLNVQLESVRDFGGNITFVPGNHDWYDYGREGLRRQEKYIEDYLSQYNETFTDYFRPSDGCGNVDVMDIAKDISLVSIDSHWFLKDLENEIDFSDCDIKNRREFVSAFKDTMATLQDRKVLLSMHHPLYTTGKHGGRFKLKTILMPLTAVHKSLVIPLPVTGAVVAKMRPYVSEQDTKSKEYTNYRKYITPPVAQHGNTIVAAGHEHTLQHHEVDGIDYIVSGSGSKKNAVGMGEYTKFAYGNYGYGIIDYYNNGEIWLTFYACGEKDSSEFGTVYRTKLLTNN